MKIQRLFKNKLLIFLIICVLVISFSYLNTFFALPGEITILEGEEYAYNFKSPFLVNITADRDGILKINGGDIKTNGNFLQLSGPITLNPQKNGSVNLNMKILGLIPLKKVKVDIVENRNIIACGNTVGVKLKLDGILIIGISDVETPDGRKVLPVKDTGIKPGDLIVGVNGAEVEDIGELLKVIEESGGKNIKVKLRNQGMYREVDVIPVKSIDDKKFHIGLWVRDNTAGIGTLTFYDPETRCFGALGHGITDIDTGSLMPVDTGEILESSILAVKKGRSGIPGELKGVFVEDKNRLGFIDKNCEFGIYGQLNDNAVMRMSTDLYPVAMRSQIEEGPAKILANTNGKTVEEYDIEIQKVSRQKVNGSKGMVIRITDKKLLELTGGIVQGMSGSPIIQNGKIVGAVTHVLVNDPARGYGIFIEQMLKNLTIQSPNGIERAS
jgi:stage IV sporulation protein B